MAFGQIINAVTKCNRKQKSLFEFTNADIKCSKFLSLQVRVNKELIFNPSLAAYKPEDETIKKKSFLSFWIALTWNFTKGRGKIISKLTLNLYFLEGTISLISSDNPAVSEGQIYKNVNVLEKIEYKKESERKSLRM